MTTTARRPDAAPPHETSPPTRRRSSAGWVGQLLLRIHFYAGILIAPFILVAASTGALYALSPQLEKVVYAQELTAPVTETSLPLADQVEAANEVVGEGQTIVAVRPAPNPGDTTRVMYAMEDPGVSETRAIFVDPGTAAIHGDLTVYGTSGALPLRAWISQFHASLHLGDVGRLYSELAASWLGVVTIIGLALWIMWVRKARRKKDFLRPDPGARGYRRIFSWHTSVGVWLVLGALFLAATGITWSQYGGANVTSLRSALNWSTPAIDASLGGGAAPVDEHAHHQSTDGEAEPTEAVRPVSPAMFDAVLRVGQEVNINTGLVEIKPPAEPGTAWVVQEIFRSYPTEVDAVAIDGTTLQVSDRVDFADFPVLAKLARWGIDTHMGSMFGLPNQILLFLTASGVIAMVVFGYLMWWKRRPTREPRAPFGSPPRRGAITRAPWWGSLIAVAIAAGVALWLPLLGVSLAAFVALDAVIGLVRARRAART